MIKEKILFAKLKSKDIQAFTEAYDLYVDKIYRFIYFKVGNKSEAEDLTSSVFLKAWNHIQQNNLTDYKTLPSLFYKIARNSVIDHYRKITNEVELTAINENEEIVNLADENQDLEKKMELTSDLALIENKLAGLKDEYREVIILRFVNELSINEIAEILNKSKGNVRVLIFRAVSALKELINEN